MRLRPLLRPVLRPLLRLPTEDSRGFWPGMLFANGEQGFLYINDISTMYQDSAGTIPAVLEQPVGKWLDQSGRGNHATQPTSANRPTVSARYNKCTNRNANPVDLTEVTKGGDAAAVLSLVDDSPALAAAGLSGICTSGKVYKLDNTAGDTAAYAAFNGATGNTNNHAISVRIRGTGQAFVRTAFTDVAGSLVALTANYRSVSTSQANVTAGAKNPTDVMQVYANAGSVVYFILNDLREAIHAIPGIPTPQVVTGSGANYDSAGFPVRLQFNGTNQWMQTGSVDFTGTARVSTGASFTKLSDAAEAVVLELTADSSANSGAFALSAPTGAAANNIRFRSRGTLSSDASAASAAPVTAVVTGLGDIGADVSILRVGGAQVASAATDQGAGNYASAVAYIGAGGGTARFLNGDIYCAYTRGALSTDSQSLSTERYMASRAGASL